MSSVLILMFGVLLIYVSIGTDLLDYIIKGPVAIDPNANARS